MLYWVILFILGEVLYKILSIYVVGLFGGGMLLIYVIITRRLGKRSDIHWMGILLFFLGVFCMHSWERMEAFCDMPEGNLITFAGKVHEKKESEYGVTYIIKTDIVNDKRIHLKIELTMENPVSLLLGSDITGNGVVKKFSVATNPGGYDEESYKHGNGIFISVEGGMIQIKRNPHFQWKENLRNLQLHFGQIYRKLFDEKNASLATAMVLGDKHNLDADVKALYQRNGIAHLIAISGLHIAMIGGTLYRLLRRLTGSYPYAAVVGVAFIITYGVMTGLSSATFRAVIMLSTAIGADVCGRRYDGLSAIALALLVMLITNPYQITQVGFLLSFGAVIGIAIVQPIWKLILSAVPRCLEGLFVSISVQLVLIPVLLYSFYEIPMYGVLLNVIVVPLMNILLGLLLACGGIGLISTSAAMLPAKLVDWIFSFYEWLCSASESLPGHTLCTGRPVMGWMILYYGILCMLVWFAYRGKRRMCYGMVAVLFGILWFLFVPVRLQICVLDVGQGDGIYIRTKHRRHILVDGGSSTEKRIGTYVLESGLKYHGADALDYVFVSHSDKDHYSGIQELLENDIISIYNLVLPAIMNPDSSYLELESLAIQKGCKVYHMKKGDSLHIDGTTFECLGPLKQAYEDKNAGSLVLQMQYGAFDMLFTGDLTTEEEWKMLDDIKRGIEVLKVAHHGSATSSSAVFLQAVAPKVACISVGERNQYGHPAKEVIKRLNQIAGKIYLTKDSGAITIRTDGTTYDIRTFVE